MRKLLPAAIMLASITLIPFASAQMMPATQPPASPVIIMPPPSNCPPDSVDPSCPPPPPKPAPATRPSLVRGFSTGGTAALYKVVTHFQRGAMQIDASRAFGFVLIPKRAIDESERNRQLYFCRFLLGALDYTTPDEAARSDMLATYWPIVADVAKPDIETAFRRRECDNLLDWYDHSLARSMARKAGIEGLGGPLLITWPSEDPNDPEGRDPLIVDFANADAPHTTKALRYWFVQLSNDPSLWTDRIREGTIRAELADAINDTAGVVMAVLAGKWESASAVSEAP